MCNCLQRLAEDFSNEYTRNETPARVTIWKRIDVNIRPYVIDRNTKMLRLSAHGAYRSIELKYCPVCGEKLQGREYINVG